MSKQERSRKHREPLRKSYNDYLKATGNDMSFEEYVQITADIEKVLGKENWRILPDGQTEVDDPEAWAKLIDEEFPEIGQRLKEKNPQGNATQEGDVTEESADKRPWLLSMLPKGRQAGGLFAFPVYSAGIRGGLQHAVKEVGANIFGEVEGYKVQHTRIPTLLHAADQVSNGRVGELGQNIKTHPLTQVIAGTLRSGHIDGLRKFQSEHGFRVVDKVLSAPIDNQAKVYQLEACVEASPEMRKELLSRIPPEQFNDFISFFQTQVRPLDVPNESPLFAPYTQSMRPVSDHLVPELRSRNGLLASFRATIAETTYERLGYWTEVPQELQHGRIPQAKVIFEP